MNELEILASAAKDMVTAMPTETHRRIGGELLALAHSAVSDLHRTWGYSDVVSHLAVAEFRRCTKHLLMLSSMLSAEQLVGPPPAPGRVPPADG